REAGGHLARDGLRPRRGRADDPARQRHGTDPRRVPAARARRLPDDLARLRGGGPWRPADRGRVDARGRHGRPGCARPLRRVPQRFRASPRLLPRQRRRAGGKAAPDPHARAAAVCRVRHGDERHPRDGRRGDAVTTTSVAPATASAATFTDAMSTLAAGIALVTCRVGGRPWAMTVTAFHSVSVDPPTVLVCLGSGTTAAEAIADYGRFGVSILPATYLALASYASRPGASKYIERFVAPSTAESAAPAVEGALAHFDCEIADQVQVRDHTVFIARVRAARSSVGA